MSRISRNKGEKYGHLKFLMYHLWRGNTDKTIKSLKSEIIAKDKKRLTEFISYIEKHWQEIINYELRKPVERTMGSGRAEADLLQP